MTRSSSPRFDFGRESAVKRFQALNRDRLNRLREILNPRQRDFLEILPLLFHINHPLLPGYVSAATPHGIADYGPSQGCLQSARRLCRSFEFDRRQPPRFALRGLYAMGSPGSVAYSRKSDLDMWLIHDAALKENEIAGVAEKASRIEAFAAGLGLEVHFFVLDAERFRRGETLSLSGESSGTSQHYVLLDEFYRSGLLIAGLPPLWWRVPSCYDDDYESYTEALFDRRVADPRDYIDFGGLSGIPAEEFFGAAVWQLYKSIDSPYKSVLKLLLMEAYASEFPHIDLLCQRFKRTLEGEAIEIDALDPYILMYGKVEEYLMSRNDSARLDVMRRSFYLKADVRVSEFDASRDPDWRAELLKHMTEAWDWRQGRTVMLDDRANWRLPVAIEERRDVSNTLRAAYASLSRFARNHAAELTISEQDLHILGRKLYAAFERKPAKIEIITRGICDAPFEPQLSLHKLENHEGQTRWVLFAGLVRPAECSLARPMKRSASPAEIVWWCHLNRLADRSTTWHVFAGNTEFTGHDIRRLHDLLAAESADFDHGVDSDSLAAPPRIVNSMLLVNVGINPFSDTLGEGEVLTTDRNDPYQFGGRRINLVRTIDLLLETSWHEAFAYRFEGEAAALQAAAECIKWFGDGSAPPPGIVARCYSGGHGAMVAERVGTIVNQVCEQFAGAPAQRHMHYVMEAGKKLLLIQRTSGQAQIETFKDCAALIRALGQIDSHDGFNQVTFDAGCTRSELLAAVYRQNRPEALQIFALPRGDRADVYVLTESGALVVQRQEHHSLEALFEHYRRFLESGYGTLSQEAGFSLKTVETLEIVQSPSAIRFRRHRRPADIKLDFLPLQVLLDVDSDAHQHMTIIIDGREFSTWEHGPSLFAQVAELVMSRRRSGMSYPIYITDLDLSAAFRRTHSIINLTSYQLLNYKKRIEYQLTRALLRDVRERGLALAS